MSPLGLRPRGVGGRPDPALVQDGLRSRGGGPSAVTRGRWAPGLWATCSGGRGRKGGAPPRSRRLGHLYATRAAFRARGPGSLPILSSWTDSFAARSQRAKERGHVGEPVDPSGATPRFSQDTRLYDKEPEPLAAGAPSPAVGPKARGTGAGPTSRCRAPIGCGRKRRANPQRP